MAINDDMQIIRKTKFKDKFVELKYVLPQLHA